MSSKRGRKPAEEKDKNEKPEKKSKGAKSDVKSEAGKRGATDGGGGRGPGGKKKGKDGEGDEEEVPIRLLELPSIMPPPPCLFVEAILPQSESGTQYIFEGWSLNQLDGLSSDFEHIGRVVQDLEEKLVSELEHIEKFEEESGGLPAPLVIEGSAGGGALFVAPAEPAVEVKAETGRAKIESSDGRAALEESSYGANEEDEFDDGYPLDEDEEDDYDYHSQVGGSKKPPPRNSFWGWMEQYFARLTPQHLALLKETKVQGDPSFVIPKLGTHYAEKWGEADNSRLTDRPRVGDVTSRLLAALVTDGNVSKKPKRRPDPEALRKSKAEDPSGAVFNRELAAQIDEKLKLNLMSMQLMSSSGLPPPDGREDDEICETIRSLQSKLKQQIKVNNAMKAELKPLVEKRLQMQVKEEDAKKEWDVVLKRYEDMMKEKKGKK